MKQLQIALHYQDGTHKTVTTYDTAAKVVRQEAKAAPKENPIVRASAFAATTNGYTHHSTYELYEGKLMNRNDIVKAKWQAERVATAIAEREGKNQ